MTTRNVVKARKKVVSDRQTRYANKPRLSTDWIQNEPPHKWTCKFCGTTNYGNVEEKVDNIVVVRCRSCTDSQYKKIRR